MAKRHIILKDEVQHLRMTLLDAEDELSRLMSLCHLGGLAADGMHGLGQNPDATALTFYFEVLRRDIEKLKSVCRKVR